MKIVAWNCNGAFRKKIHQLESLDADILVIQECEDPMKVGEAFKGWSGNYLWTGKNNSKGLAVFAKSNIRLERLDWVDGDYHLFLPCRVNDQFNLLAVWTQGSRSNLFPYVGQIWHYLQIHKERIAANQILVCGDFNSNSIWDKRHRIWNHSDIVREFDEIDIHSLYHKAKGEDHGKESETTFYLQRKIEKPYHIDYAFLSKQLAENSTIEVGNHEDWLEYSDHMPLTITLLP